MSEALKQMRKELSRQVDGAWVGKLDAKDALANIARGAYEKCLEECARGTEPITECYKKCAEKVGLKEKYRSIWGSPSGSGA